MDGDLPVISLPTDSTKIELARASAASAPEPVRRPATELRKPAVAPPPAAPKPASDPRNASELRRIAPPPAPKAEPAPAAPVEEDPEKLLREYADRQKTKISRLEAQLVELKKVAAERDQFRSKSETLARDLEGARRQLEAASKQDAVIKDLQAKVDASLLAHSMLTDENGKLKAKAQELAALARKLEEKSAHAEKALAEATRSLASQTEGRKDAEARIAAALGALQGEAAARKAAASPPAVAKK